MAISKESMREYRSSWARGERKRIRRAKHRREMAFIEARRLAKLLRREYGAKEVVLFGSVIDKKKFKEDSDIDLAVFGIAPESYYSAVAACMERGEFKVDIVDGMSTGALMKERIKRGITLHE